MEVKATARGVYADQRRYPGDKFPLRDARDFSPSWMEKVKAKQEEATGGNPPGGGGEGGDAVDSHLSAQTVPILKEMAEALEIEGAANMKKADLIAAIKAKQEEATGE